MNVPLPEFLEGSISPEDAALHLALGLFLDERVTLGKGAAVAGISETQFLRELGKRGIPIHYDEADARADVATIEQMDLG
jgi:predicted HTH domain antitoxin